MRLQLNLRNQNIADFEELTHDSITCAACLNPIKGFRFKGQLCDRYDFCKERYQRRADIHGVHLEFLQIPDASTYVFSSRL